MKYLPGKMLLESKVHSTQSVSTIKFLTFSSPFSSFGSSSQYTVLILLDNHNVRRKTANCCTLIECTLQIDYKYIVA